MIVFPAGPVYDEPFRTLLVDRLGVDGAWLLLSLDHYMWRATYDLAIALCGSDGESLHHSRHLQSLVDLQVQSFLYSVVEQFARLMKAIAVHEDGTRSFFDAYVQRYHSVPNLLEEIAVHTREDLNAFFSVPDDVALLVASSRRLGEPLADEVAVESLTQVKAVVYEISKSLTQFGQMIERPDLAGTGAPVQAGHSLRNVDNAYRHGLKVLLHDALPADRVFGVAVHGHAEPLSQYAIDLYQHDNEPRFATIDARPERTDAHLHAIGVVAVRIKQAVRGFVARLMAEPVVLLSMIAVNLEQLDQSLTRD